MKKAISVLTAILLVFALAACDSNSGTVSGTSGETSGTQSSTADTSDGNSNLNGDLSNYDMKTEYDEATAVKITFDGENASITGSGATAEKGKVTITKEGAYVLSGTTTDGCIIVNVNKDEKVHLVLNNVNITSKSYAAIHVMSADKVKITTVEGSVNRVTDGSNYTGLINDNEPTGCIFSKDDLTVNGSGTLFVIGNYNNGIASKNDLKIVGGVLNITAKNHGLKGKDSVIIAGGNLSINAGNDGIKSDNELEKGFILVTGGVIDVKAGDDALQGFSAITATGGKITASAEGKITNCDGTVDIKSGVLTVVNE